MSYLLDPSAVYIFTLTSRLHEYCLLWLGILVYLPATWSGIFKAYTCFNVYNLRRPTYKYETDQTWKEPYQLFNKITQLPPFTKVLILSHCAVRANYNCSRCMIITQSCVTNCIIVMIYRWIIPTIIIIIMFIMNPF